MDILEFEAFFHQPVLPNEYTTQVTPQTALFPQNTSPEMPLLYPQTTVFPQQQSWRLMSPNNTPPTTTVPIQQSSSLYTIVQDEKGIKRYGEKLEDEEKSKSRKANQNLACRNYRRRKKEHLQELEAKIAGQEQELEALRKEVTMLKRTDAFEAIDPALTGLLEEMRQIVEKLDEAVKSNAVDSEISRLLKLYLQSAEKRHVVASRETEKLVNPLTQAKLATMGYTPTRLNPIYSCLFGPDGDDWWKDYEQEISLTEPQVASIATMRKRYWDDLQQLQTQRLEIDDDIKAFYLQHLRLVPNLHDLNSRFVRGAAASKLEMADIVHFAQQLSAMKKSFATARSMMLNVHKQLGDILTPRQHALLLIRLAATRTFDWPRHVQTLRSAWQLFGEVSSDVNKANNNTQQ